jgi:hypothetical protein
LPSVGRTRLFFHTYHATEAPTLPGDFAA